MRTTSIVVANQFTKDSLQVGFTERNDPIETFSTDGPDQPLAISVGLRRSSRRFQNSDSEAAHGAIRVSGKDRVAIMDQESVRMVEGEKLAELLDGPFSSGMQGYVVMQNAPRTNLHRDENIDNSESGRDRNKDVAIDNGLRVIPNEGRPALAIISPRGRSVSRYLRTVRGEMPN